MNTKKPVKVLVVDDSIVFREVLARGISCDPDIIVVAVAKDPFEARDKIIQFDPDVMTCDVEMPKMNGIEFIRRLMPQHPIPVIVVSAASNAVFEAMNAGAVDFVMKPDVRSVISVGNFMEEMIEKIKICSLAKVGSLKTSNSAVQMKTSNPANADRIIAIGASTGGTEAIYKILKCFPGNMPGVVLVQHIPPVFSRMFAERLNNSTALRVKEASTGDCLEIGSVLVAPGDRHMMVRRFGGKYKVECFEGEKVNGHRPSVDILFESVAKEAGDKAVGIILSGMGYDGAKGLLSMRKRGARTIGQDEGSSVVYGMPKVAFNIGAVEKQAPLEDIPALVQSMLG